MIIIIRVLLEYSSTLTFITYICYIIIYNIKYKLLFNSLILIIIINRLYYSNFSSASFQMPFAFDTAFKSSVGLIHFTRLSLASTWVCWASTLSSATAAVLSSCLDPGSSFLQNLQCLTSSCFATHCSPGYCDQLTQ